MNDFVTCIHNDVVVIICKFLPPADIITLYKMYPKILSKITYIFSRRVGEEIDDFFRHVLGGEYAQFRQEMINSDAVLSGSLILQACLGKRWAGHSFNRLDVDLFVRVNPIYGEHNPDWRGEKAKGYTFYNNELKFKLGYTNLHNFLHDIKEKGSGYVTNSQYMDEMGENVILRVNNYIIRKKYVFQVVEINKEKHSSCPEFINNTVDFNICKNFFRYTTEGFEIVLGDITAILNKKATFNYVGSLVKSLRRCEKYMGREFSFTAANNLDASSMKRFKKVLNPKPAITSIFHI